MIKMFCLKDQKNPPAHVSAAAAALVYYCCCFFFDVVICVPFFPPGVTGKYDLRKGEKKEEIRW